MPLRDHFHPPLSSIRHWQSFHAQWATAISNTLEANVLPPGYFAEVQVHTGSRVEVDVATFEDEAVSAPAPADAEPGNGTALAVAAANWAPPVAEMILPAIFPDRIEVLIFQTDAGPTLVSAIELVSPGNKDRTSNRRAFAVKCANYLRCGVSAVIVDIVTSRTANPHNELITLMELEESYRLDKKQLYAIAYQPVQTNVADEIRVWSAKLEIGGPLPELPLPLDKGQLLRFDLDATYTLACQRMRLPAEDNESKPKE